MALFLPGPLLYEAMLYEAMLYEVMQVLGKFNIEFPAFGHVNWDFPD